MTFLPGRYDAAGPVGLRRAAAVSPLPVEMSAPDPQPAGGPRGGILVVCSSGGHLAQLVSMQEAFHGRHLRWVTFPTADALSLLAGEDVVHAHHPTTRNIPNLVRNAGLALRLLVRDRPAAIISSGAGVALPFFVFGWLLRIPTVYIEVFDRLDTRTLTGRLCRPFTTRMLVQWEEQLPLYRNAVLVGALL